MPQTITELNAKFAIRDHITFHEDEPGMPKMRIATDASDATLYLYGAHLTQWTPRGGSPVLYVSPNSWMETGKPIRGGVPVLFPWFGPRWNAAEYDAAHSTTSPMHGYGRTMVWQLDRVHLDPTGEVEVTMSLPMDQTATTYGFAGLHSVLEFRIGKELHMTLSATNRGTEAVAFEEGFHTYFAIGDIHAVRVLGLRGSTYIDKRDNATRKVQRETELAFTRDVDQLHVHTSEPLVVVDPGNHRAIHIRKTGSQSTVVWNPWTVLTPNFADLAPDSWEHFACVEVVNAADDRVTLAAGATHGMDMTISVTPL